MLNKKSHSSHRYHEVTTTLLPHTGRTPACVGVNEVREEDVQYKSSGHTQDRWQS